MSRRALSTRPPVLRRVDGLYYILDVTKNTYGCVLPCLAVSCVCFLILLHTCWTFDRRDALGMLRTAMRPQVVGRHLQLRSQHIEPHVRV